MWLDRYVSEVNSRARLVRFINESFRFCELHKLIFGNITISEISVKVFSKKKTKKQFNGVISIEWSNLHSLSLHWKLAEWQHFWMTYPFNIHISKWHLGVFFLFFVFRSYTLYWFPSSDLIVFIVSAFNFHWASSNSWEVENIRVWERENLRVLEWVSRGIFFVVAELFSP